jgi:hypothetical protein
MCREMRVQLLYYCICKALEANSYDTLRLREAVQGRSDILLEKFGPKS